MVSSPLYRYAVSTRGAALVSAQLLQYPSYVREGDVVELVPEGTEDFLAHRVLAGGDTLDLRALSFRTDTRSVRLGEGDAPVELRLVAPGNGGIGAEIVYTFRPDSYRVDIRGRLLGIPGGDVQLLTDIGPGLAPHEALDHRSEQELAVVAHSDGDIERLRFGKIEGAEILPGPLDWVGMRDKYFLAALLGAEGADFSGAVVQALPAVELVRAEEDEAVLLPRAEVTAALPLGADGSFEYSVYLGPQEFGRLAAAGAELEEVTPYSYQWLQPIIRPFAGAILWVLDFLHENLGWKYGWVLILFGVMMRVVLWPLNAKAMRSQTKNMAVQPILQERMKAAREKYANDPQRQQQEIMAVYQELGVNPLSMMSGCLPMLIPFPVLITLFFVFQNSIVFRGAEFLWLPDLSLQDPFYILPVFLVVSMFALQWIIARLGGMEQNPQMKMMMYFMPLMMGVLFFNLPSGLNLYYATTNIATIPQQVLIAKERRQAQEAMKEKGLKPALATASSGGGGGGKSKRKRKRRAGGRG